MKINKEKAITVGQAILTIAALTAFVTFASVVPGTLHVLRSFGFGKRELKRREYYIDDSLDRLIKRRLLVVVNKDGKKYLKITPDGKRILLRFEVKQQMIDIPKKWDKKYRVVIFDIRENLKFLREDLRFTLLQLGFIKLQNSVWVYPYPCETIINLLKARLEVGEEVVYMTVESIDNDEWLRKYFKLSS